MKDLAQQSDRKPPRASRPRQAGSKPFTYDRHGDLIVEDLDDGCGATVAERDPHALRWLAVR